MKISFLASPEVASKFMWVVGGVDQLITLSTPTQVEVGLGLGCGWAVTIIEKYYIEN